MDKKRLNIIRGIRDLDYPLEGCGYYDWDGDWNWWPSVNDCWNKYTTAQLKQFYTECMEAEEQEDDD